jgi:hypothetical protein
MLFDFFSLIIFIIYLLLVLINDETNCMSNQIKIKINFDHFLSQDNFWTSEIIKIKWTYLKKKLFCFHNHQ